MKLGLHDIEVVMGAESWLHPLSLALPESGVTVLLGATQAGKTTLMRVMAGLDRPTRGRVTVDGADVTGRPVRERDVAMVYQQFINYPSMTVAQNIASPLRLKGGISGEAIQQRVQALAEQLRIAPFLNRLPAELSGGQQQRVALARALAKAAPLMLLDEPLVNLDYKLREELRDELTQLFRTGASSVVYATTEPSEALLLGGHVAVLDQGELVQFGPTAEVFRRPASIRVARAFSDPPMNLIAAQPGSESIVVPGALSLPWPAAVVGKATAAGAPSGPAPRAAPATPITLGCRASSLRVAARPGDLTLTGVVELAEISGSDTYLHARTAAGPLVAQLHGVHRFTLGEAITLALDPQDIYLFGPDGALWHSPGQV